METTPELIEEHGITEDEYQRIVELLGREPNLVELGIFSVMWSEHCSYKSSRLHLGKFPTEGERVIQGPGENAGVVDIGDGLCVVFKIESHNHPSFIEPYQGAATGVGGILRDIFTMGARPIALLDSLRFGSPDQKKTSYLLKGVVSGIADYGNCVGIPTVGGELYFHPSYNGNCLVNVMALGIAKKESIFRALAEGVGNPVIYVGSPTGRDGIHGATMASDVFGEGGEERRPTVQVGDPFTEKLLLEACLEAFGTGCVVGVQDMGAAGLTSSSSEMAARANSGIEIDVEKVPRREEGMTPYEVMLSESQERMLFVARKGGEERLLEIFRKWDLNAAIIGRVIEEQVMRIKEGDKVVAEIPVGALTEDAPRYRRPSRRPTWQDDLNRLDTDGIPLPQDYARVLERLLSSLNIASGEWIYTQYDHMVRTNTVVLPGGDAAVLRIKGTQKAVALTVDCNPRYCYLDPYRGGLIAVFEAARNLTVSGATPIGLTDCLNFGSPEREEVMWQFEKAIEGMRDACCRLGVPVVSGNVSFYNETGGVSVYPTPVVGMVGLIEDVERCMTPWFKKDGDMVALLGWHAEEFGGSEYLSVEHGLERGMPELDVDRELRVQEACRQCIMDGIINAAHDTSEGGLAVALAEMCFGPERTFGVRIGLRKRDIRADALLFGEAQSRILVSFSPENGEKVAEVAEKRGVNLDVLGTVGGERFVVDGLMDVEVERLRSLWKGGLEGFIEGGKVKDV